MYKVGSELKAARLDDLRPTQMTVGFRAVEKKRREIEGEMAGADRPRYFFPAVRGPRGRFFILDGHHTALALHQQQVEDVAIGIVTDLSALSRTDFWTYLDHRAWTHCYDARGVRRSFADMPARLADLADDPYRSLAAAVLAGGAFAKPDEPFYEFMWANHFRRHFARPELSGRRFEGTVTRAAALAGRPESRYLPGWAGTA